MKKSKKFFNKGKKGGFNPTTKHKRKAAKDQDIVNKKAIFNRYKNAQKREEVVERQKLMERKLQQMQVEYSESEEEEDAYGQLVSCFGGTSKERPVADSDESETSGQSDADDAQINNRKEHPSGKGGDTDIDSDGTSEHDDDNIEVGQYH